MFVCVCGYIAMRASGWAQFTATASPLLDKKVPAWEILLSKIIIVAVLEVETYDRTKGRRI